MENFIKEIEQLGFKLKVSGKNLLLLGKEGKLTPQEIQVLKKNPNIPAFIKENKSKLIPFLNKQNFKLDRNNVASMYGLSPTQEGILFHSSYLYDSDFKTNTTYHTQFDIAFNSDIDIDKFKKAWSYVITNHTILRTGFLYDKINAPIQFVNKEVALPFNFFDLSEVSKEDQEKEYKVLKNKDRYTNFDFRTPPLMRITLVRLGDQSYKMIWTKHHILWDGWSGQILIKEVIDAYNKLSQRKTLTNIVEDKYEDFIDYLKSINSFEEKDFWKNYLEGFSQPTLLPFCKVTHERNKGKGIYKRKTVSYEESLTSEISAFTKSNHITPNTLMQGIWSYLVSQYTGSKDVVFGVTVSGRPVALNCNNKVGLYINTIPLRATFTEGESINDFLDKLQKMSVEARQFQHTALNKIQDWSNIKGDCFDSLLSFTNYPKTSSTEEEMSLSIEEVNIKENNNYLLSIQPLLKEELSVDFTFNTSILDESYIEMIIQHFSIILRQIVSNKVSSFEDLKMNNDEESEKLINGFNFETVPYPRNKNIIDLFEDKVEKYPDNIALSLEGNVLTYRELNSRVNQLAAFLKSKGVQSNDLIGICVDRSFEMIIGVLSILKVGGAYVPIDPEYPKERVSYIFENANVNLILVDDSSKKKVADVNSNVQQINIKENKKEFASFSSDNLNIEISQENLAYVIYTSGTTGKPKGVLLNHKNVVRLFENDASLFDISNNDVWTLFHSFCFDFSVWEIFGALLHGGKLVIVPGMIAKNTKLFAELLEKEQVTVLNQTPSAFQSLQEQEEVLTLDLNLRYLIFGGEALSPTNLASWHKHFPTCKLINMYGITETTVHVTYREIGAKEITASVSDIGMPIPTMSCYVLDENLDLVPLGVVGELYVGGEGVSVGYLNRPELTAERFIVSPFDKNKKLYKTGDLARRLPDGNLEYIGRNDDQVKIRGYRIELGEIETALNTCYYCKQGTVVVRNDSEGNNDLVGFIVLKEGFNKADVQAHLKSSLPNYMIPTIIIELDEIPLTSNGKINKKALPSIDFNGENSKENLQPRNEREEKIASIWKDVLGVDHIGIRDDFFENGGHSLKLTRLINKYHKKFGKKLELKDLFINKTIEEHVHLIFDGVQASDYLSIDKLGEQENYSVSRAQYRMWLSCQSEASQSAYNMFSRLKIDEVINVDAIKKAVLTVLERHEILRTVYKVDNTAELRQYVISPEDAGFNIGFKDFSQEVNPEWAANNYISEDCFKPFDLEKGPVIRVSLLKVADTTYMLYYNIHHIAGDGVSMNLLKRDFSHFYQCFNKGIEPSLPVLKIQYKDYANWQLEQLKTSEFQKHKKFWMDKLSGYLATLDLPDQKERFAVKTTNGQTIYTFISEEMTNWIDNYAKTKGGTRFTVVLALWNLLFYKKTNIKDIILGTPVAGRNHEDLENQIGMYFNTMVLRNKINPYDNFEDLFNQINTSAIEASKHQVYPFDQLVEDMQLQGNQGRSLVYDVMLSYHNALDHKLDFEVDPNEIDLIKIKDNRESKLDMIINVKECTSNLYIDINYNTDLYSFTTMKSLLNDFKLLINEVKNHTDKKIASINLQDRVTKNLKSLNASKLQILRK